MNLNVSLIYLVQLWLRRYNGSNTNQRVGGSIPFPHFAKESLGNTEPQTLPAVYEWCKVLHIDELYVCVCVHLCLFVFVCVWVIEWHNCTVKSFDNFLFIVQNELLHTCNTQSHIVSQIIL